MRLAERIHRFEEAFRRYIAEHSPRPIPTDAGFARGVAVSLANLEARIEALEAADAGRNV